MTFEETKWNIESVVITPLLAFRGKTAPLNQIHNDTIHEFANIMSGLLTGSDGETEFRGPGSMALANLIGNYITTEQSITGSGSDFVGHLLEAAIESEKIAHQLQQQLSTIAAEQDHTVEAASSIALGLDAGAVAQGGVDVPWDIVAAGASLIAAGIAATHNPDQDKAQKAEMAKYIAITEWNNKIQGIIAQPLPPLTPSPSKPNGDTSDFQKMIGLGALVAASTTATTTGINSGKLFSTMKTTSDGRRVRVRKLSPGEVKRLRTPWGEKFHDLKGKGYRATDEIYEDQDGNYWIGSPKSDNVEPFP